MMSVRLWISLATVAAVMRAQVVALKQDGHQLRRAELLGHRRAAIALQSEIEADEQAKQLSRERDWPIIPSKRETKQIQPTVQPAAGVPDSVAQRTQQAAEALADGDIPEAAKATLPGPPEPPGAEAVAEGGGEASGRLDFAPADPAMEPLRMNRTILGPFGSFGLGVTNREDTIIPTRGQDWLDCGFLRLPPVVQLMPRQTQGYSRYVDWETPDGGTLAQGSQEMFKKSPEYVHVLDKLLYKAESAFVKNFDGKTPNVDTITVRDCRDDVMYVIVRDQERRGCYGIYDQAGRLLAQSSRSFSTPEQLRFFDASKVPIAVAQTPVLYEAGTRWAFLQRIAAHVSAAQGIARRAASWSAGTGPAMYTSVRGVDWESYEPRKVTGWGIGSIQPWEIWFFTGMASGSPLAISQNRWILAAVVQDMALRDAMRGVQNLDQSPWVLSIRVLCVVVPVALVFFAILGVYRLVYPIQKHLDKPYFQASPDLVYAMGTPGGVEQAVKAF